MKDFKNDTSATLSRFGRDKRTRMTTQTAERVERRPHREDDAERKPYRSESYGRNNDEGAGSGYRPQKRASYNPNFTEDNRPVYGSRSRQPYDHSSGDNRGNSYGGSRSSAGPRPQNRYGGSQRNYGDDRSGGYGSYGGGERKYSQNRYQKSSAPRRYYDENGDIDGNRIDIDDPAYDFQQRSYRSGNGSGYGRSDGSRGNRPAQRGAKPYGKPSQQRRDQPARPDYKGKGASGAPRGGKQNRKDDRPKVYPKYSPEKHLGEMRLNRFIAQSGVCSRREADDFITAGLVTVNGEVVTTLGSKVNPGDDVRFNGTRIQGEHKVYLVLNKPKGYVTSLDDPHADKTVMELVKGACSERIYPVGRLDKNSVGLLLFTNDGDLTRKLTHPSLEKKKVYQVSLDKPLTNADMQSIADGIMLDDGEIHADEIAYAKEDKKEIGIEIHSGRNRVVRRIFEHLGYKVQKLDRVYYAGLTKKNLKRGAWRFLTDAEVNRLKSGQYE